VYYVCISKNIPFFIEFYSTSIISDYVEFLVCVVLIFLCASSHYFNSFHFLLFFFYLSIVRTALPNAVGENLSISRTVYNILKLYSISLLSICILYSIFDSPGVCVPSVLPNTAMRNIRQFLARNYTHLTLLHS